MRYPSHPSYARRERTAALLLAATPALAQVKVRLEELHRAVRPRRALRAGARSGRHQGRAQDQPRRHADRAQGARGKADRPLPRVHGNDPARRAQAGADDRPQGRLRQGQGRVRGEGPRRAERGADQQHVQHGRAAGNRGAVQARDALRPRQGVEGAEARRRTRVPRPQGRAARAQGEVRNGVQGRPAARDRAALPGAREQADRGRQRLLHRRHDRRDEAEAPEGRQGPVAAVLRRAGRAQGGARRESEDRRGAEPRQRDARRSDDGGDELQGRRREDGAARTSRATS